MSKITYIYDGSFDGFLTAVFEAYASKELPLQIVSERNFQPAIFDTHKKIITDSERSERVWNGLVTRSSDNVSNMFYMAFASELPGIETDMFHYLEKLFADPTRQYHQNLLDDHSFRLYEVARKVGREVHRFHGFVRFQETSDGLSFSVIDPDHDIVALLAPHFVQRYACFQWVIYDKKRDKGIFYDLSELREIQIVDKQFDLVSGKIRKEDRSEEEDFYKKLWKAYYQATHIPERKNTKLMMHFLPRRYWKYLPEKQWGE